MGVIHMDDQSNHPIRPDILPRVRALLHVPDQDLGAGAAVAVGLMVIQADAVVIAHVVQLVADPRQKAPAHDHRTDAFSIRLPLNFIALQAFPEDAHIEAGIMGHKDSRRHYRLNLLPHLREVRSVKNGLLVNAGEHGVEPVKGLLRIDQRKVILNNPAVLDDADANGAYSVVKAVRRLYVENYESEQGVVLLRPTEPVKNGDKVF